MADRLAGQTSPYLMQHLHNPVDWWPWGPEALAEARSSNKPLMLSIGYAACHWCHVMAHESFENPIIAQIINDRFIPIKVDREERPDLDAIYQQALAALQQSGGWPLTMFLSPSGEPFWGGTYFPPESRWGRPGFVDVLHSISDVWLSQPGNVKANVDGLLEALNKHAVVPGEMSLTLPLLDECARRLLPGIDRRRGGMKGAPKFPQPGIFGFLWRSGLRTNDAELKQAVTVTLNAICQGGIYDHLGGGFMRYSTDEEWLVPHFEKMLYDNAQLIELLCLAYQNTGSDLYKQRVDETIGWMLREMIAEDGAFAATLDADSEGGEGHFYTWEYGKIAKLLGDDLKEFSQAYDVSENGNWEGRIILRRQENQVDEARLDVLRSILMKARGFRPRPGRDDKILADWNGMAISALVHAAIVFDRQDWLKAAQTAFAAICEHMDLGNGRLAHARCLGQSGQIGLLDDLGHMARAAIALYEAKGEQAYIERARTWLMAAQTYHWDEELGGYFQATKDSTDIIIRLKPIHDAAVPSANGIMAEVLAHMGQITGDDDFTHKSEAVIATFSAAVPQDFPHMTALLAGFEQLTNPVEITLTGNPESAAALLREIARVALPNRVLRWTDPSQIPTAMVCRAATCGLAQGDAEQLRAELCRV